jgi:hypothetical protein
VYEIVAASTDVRELKGMIKRAADPSSVEDMRRRLCAALTALSGE